MTVFLRLVSVLPVTQLAVLEIVGARENTANGRGGPLAY